MIYIHCRFSLSDMAKVTLQPPNPTDSLSTPEAFAVNTEGSSAVPSVPQEEEGKKKNKRLLVFFVHDMQRSYRSKQAGRPALAYGTGRSSARTKPVQRSPL